MLRHRAAIAEYEQALRKRLSDGLKNISGVNVYDGPAGTAHTGVVSFNIGNLDSGRVADLLNREKIAVRAGLHCAPSIHAWLGTTGAVRASLGPFNTEKETVDFLMAVLRISREGGKT